MKSIVTILSLLISLTSCVEMAINDDIDRTIAKELIDKYDKTNKVDSTLLKNANIEKLIPNGDYYLCINNSMIGDFNGEVYSKYGRPVPDSIRFEIFYIKFIDTVEGKWTKVSGSW